MRALSELSIVIVNWNGGELFRRCIESIERYRPAVPCEVIVVDNASSDDSVAWARARAASSPVPLTIIENRENVGFARANNRAFMASRSPLLFLLNADAEVTEGAIDRLMATLREHPDVAAVAPRLLNTDGSLQPSVWPNPLTPLHILAAALGIWRLLPRAIRGPFLLADHWTYDSLRRVPMASGAALLVRREVIDRIGGFDERFEMYGEDNEWCLRMRRAGWRVLFDPGASVVHHHGSFAAVRWGDLGRLQVNTEAQLRLQRIALSRVHRLANVLTLSCVTVAQLLGQRLRGLDTAESRLRLRLYIRDLTRRG